MRVLRLLGCDTLVVTNAAGCVNTDWKAGELMLITDHIKMFSESPLRGENLPEFGVRFPDASKLYTPRCARWPGTAPRSWVSPCGRRLLLLLRSPVRDPGGDPAARILGGDRGGHVHRPRGHCAGHCGMEVLGFTLLSNMAAGILDQPSARRRSSSPGSTPRRISPPGAGLPAGDVTEFLICKE